MQEKRGLCKKKLQYCNSKLREKFMKLTKELNERNLQLLEYENNYEKAKVRNLQNEDEIAKIKEQCKEMSEVLNSYRNERSQMPCERCAENVLAVTNVERDNYQLTLELNAIQDQVRVFLSDNCIDFNINEQVDLKWAFDKVKWIWDGLKKVIENYEYQINITDCEAINSLIDENQKLKTEIDLNKKQYQLSLSKYENESIQLKSQIEVLQKNCEDKKSKIQELLDCYELKVNGMGKDYDLLHDEYLKLKKEICELHGHNKALTDQYEQLKNDRQQQVPVIVHNAAINDYKNRIDEIKQLLEAETSKNRITIEGLNEKIKVLSDCTKTIEEECVKFKSQVKDLEKTNKKLQNEIKSRKDREKRLESSKNSCKKLIKKTVKFAKEVINEHERILKQLMQKHKENIAVKKDGKHLGDMFATLKKELKEVQKESLRELKAIENYLIKKEADFEDQRKSYLNEINNLKKQLKEKNFNNV